MSEHAIETLQDEERRFPPPPEFTAQANAKADVYAEPFESFWERNGRERVAWFEPFESSTAGSCRTRSGIWAGS